MIEMYLSADGPAKSFTDGSVILLCDQLLHHLKNDAFHGSFDFCLTGFLCAKEERIFPALDKEREIFCYFLGRGKVQENT